MHALDPVQYSYNAEYLSAVTRTVGFYSHLYVALNVSKYNTDGLYKPDKAKIQITIDYLNEFYNQNDTLMFGKIYNLSNLGSLDIEHMHMFAQFLKSIASKTEQQVYASSIIIKSTIVRALLNTFLTLYKNARPIKIVDNIKDAKLFIKKEMMYYKTHGVLSDI